MGCVDFESWCTEKWTWNRVKFGSNTYQWWIEIITVFIKMSYGLYIKIDKVIGWREYGRFCIQIRKTKIQIKIKKNCCTKNVDNIQWSQMVHWAVVRFWSLNIGKVLSKSYSKENIRHWLWIDLFKWNADWRIMIFSS